MSCGVHENRKSRASTGSMNIYLFHKVTPYADKRLMHLNFAAGNTDFSLDVLLHAGSRLASLPPRTVHSMQPLLEAMFSGGLREKPGSEVDFHDSIHPEVLGSPGFAYSSQRGHQ
ncbi:ectoderm-neural cortex protein 1 [Lates japonicus]|uniref:Ectoderm-neural cortex protein 1 n=1 Tax=Lates japonicus TaxID=270547 RepID=A0AAD3QZE6_LATJO|nr:ectoderm-neural cortex protein 1 [Lates japonicus]